MNEKREWDPVDLAASWVSPPGLGRCIGIGIGIGIALAFVGVAVPSLLSGMEVGSALGFGTFVAFWGGLGFGSMMGGVAYVMGLERAAAAEAAAAEAAGKGGPDAGAEKRSDELSLADERVGDRHVA